MKIIYCSKSLFILCFFSLVSTANAAVTICHIPPGNPANQQIITVGDKAALAHYKQHADYAVSTEVCDGKDNDCDGLVDEDGACGCADKLREGFVNASDYPEIAGCSGGWSVPGVLLATPQCANQAGDDSSNPTGTGCGAADLCAAGWHICADSAEVAAKSSTGCGNSTQDGDPDLFFTSSQSGPGDTFCGVGANDIFGCGNMGAIPDAGTCSPLDRFSHDLCSALPVGGWDCGTTFADSINEANLVTKGSADGGGVLCCKD